MREFLQFPVEASAHAAQIDKMTILTHWLMAILFVGWGAYFIFALVRFRAGANPKASYEGVKSHLASYIEWAVAGIELVLIVVFAIPAWASRVDAFPQESQATVVRVVAEQFAWNAHYPGADGQFGRVDPKLMGAENPLGIDRTDPAAKDDITTINQLHPAGEQAGHRAPLEQGRHSQLQPDPDAREAGRHSRGNDPGLVHADRRRATGKSTARSCAASVTTACAALTRSSRRPTTTPG